MRRATKRRASGSSRRSIRASVSTPLHHIVARRSGERIVAGVPDERVAHLGVGITRALERGHQIDALPRLRIGSRADDKLSPLA